MTRQSSCISIGSFLKLTLKATFITVPGVLIGLALCATVIGIPLGLWLIFVACKPMANHVIANLPTVVINEIEPEPDWEVPTRQSRIEELML